MIAYLNSLFPSYLGVGHFDIGHSQFDLYFDVFFVGCLFHQVVFPVLELL